ncbi:TRAP transporter permease [Chelativorans xinjiangense]|uniref:TRAP transporter permease n=1 Tax=Chelativorans xinjiangense TaxID=2681485 RepID=UPI0019161007|nr:TRAP transporter fused permease subunit [Chelativorans xinjiangense]
MLDFTAAGRALARLSAPLAIALSLLGLYIAGFGFLNETMLRVGTYALAALILILHTMGEGKGRLGRARFLVDLLLLAGLALSVWRYLQIGKALEIGLYSFSATDVAIGVTGLAVLVELTRRSFGLPLVLVCLAALGYGVFGDRLPWIFEHGGFGLSQILQVVWYSFDGVFGRPLSVVVTLILAFIVFGVVLEGIGAGPVLIRFAFALTGRSRGGPAHAAVAASCVFGTMSGSVAGNVVGTGVMTIPMIKERGFSARYAGGIEAAASSGGQFMPPIMGAVAFIMSDVTGIPYLTICIGALLPALFYYGSLFASVQIEAVKRGIGPIPAGERVELTRRDWVMSLCFAIPLAIVIALLIGGRSPAFAGFVAVIAAVLLGFTLNPELRRQPGRLLDALHQAGLAAAQIIIAVGAIGIVIGIMNMTGLGLRFANIILGIAGDSLFLALVMMMLSSLVLGMGMPTVPAYLVVVIVMGPAIEAMGVPTLIAHLFVVYFGVLSAITPPVAIAAFAAAPIARANPMGIGVDACRVALIGFIIPFVLVYNPSLSLVIDFSLTGLLWICFRLALAIWLLATGLAGYASGRLTWVSRVLRCCVGLAILLPAFWIELTGFAAAMLFVVNDATPYGAPIAGWLRGKTGQLEPGAEGK